MKTLNEVFSSLSTRRRYEVWFLRFALADNSGAWWLRYLLMNPGRNGCDSTPQGMPVQVWATWFPAAESPETFIQGFSLRELQLSDKGVNPFSFQVGENQADENSCRGALAARGHSIAWDLHYRSTFRTTVSNKGWIGFSRTPHSDAVFSGHITLDSNRIESELLGYGLQGHNCGYRHRGFWRWTHAFFPRGDRAPSTLEALVYDMPFGLIFRKAVLWHEGEAHIFRKLDETTIGSEPFRWHFCCAGKSSPAIEVAIDGQSASVHRLPYIKTDCSGSFEVTNNSLAAATVRIAKSDGSEEKLETANGAVLEMAGES